MITAFLQIFGKLLLWLYNTCHSYALALIIFTLLTKLILFPISYRGKKSMMQTQSLNAELQKLQKQYGKDRDRLNEETQKLYQREGVNPMSGCLWSFLPLPILMGLYYIIRRPMLYMMCLTKDEITAAIDAVQKLGYDIGTNVAYQELKVSAMMNQTDVYNAVAGAVGDSASKLSVIDFHWLGIDLAATPNWKIWTIDLNWSNIGLFLIPIVVTVVSFLYSKLSQKTNAMTSAKKDEKSKSDTESAMEQSTKTMMIMMPLMYLWFGYVMPAGMCVYMIFNSVFMAAQEVICAFMLRGKFEEMEKAREQRALEEKEAEKRRKAEIAARRAEQEKKNKGKKNVRSNRSKKGGTSKSKDRPTEASRVGMRPFARGRAYDPGRYPVTSYRDPQDVLDEAALEAALATRKKGRFQNEAKEAPETELEPLEKPVIPETPAEETEEAVEATEIVEEAEKDNNSAE